MASLGFVLYGQYHVLLLTLPPQAPVAWIYCSEVFPLKYRAKGVGLSAATNWMSVARRLDPY